MFSRLRDQAPEDDLAEDAEGEPPEEELLEAQPTQTRNNGSGADCPGGTTADAVAGAIGGRAGDRIEGTDSAGNSGTGTAGRRDGKYMKTTRRDFLCLGHGMRMASDGLPEPHSGRAGCQLAAAGSQ
ncbi:MAG: hypothetical protein ACLVJH_02800 [Faecalibacterium prausnitzii]